MRHYLLINHNGLISLFLGGEVVMRKLPCGRRAQKTSSTESSPLPINCVMRNAFYVTACFLKKIVYCVKLLSVHNKKPTKDMKTTVKSHFLIRLHSFPEDKLWKVSLTFSTGICAFIPLFLEDCVYKYILLWYMNYRLRNVLCISLCIFKYKLIYMLL